MMERLQSLPPEERARVLERMRARGFDPAPSPDGPAEPSSGSPATSSPERPRDRLRRGGEEGDAAPLAARRPGATTIDALFGPLPAVEAVGRVWLYVDKQLQPVRVRLGITDGQATELLEGDITEGTLLVTNVATGNETRPAAGAFPPFMGPPGRFGGGPGGFGGFGGGGGGRGGGR
jgi:hypothetical protein